MSLIASTLQSFFTERLAKQRRVTPRTIASFRDSLKLLIVFVHEQTGKKPCDLDWDDLDTEMICAFLDHLEAERRKAREPAISASPRSGRCSPTRRCGIQNTPH